MAVRRDMPGLKKCTRCAAITRPLSHRTLGDICALCLKPLRNMPPGPLSKKERRAGKREISKDRQAWGKGRRKSRPGGVKIKHNKRMTVYQRDGMRCVACGSDDFRSFTIDHIIPLSKGGTNRFDNLQTMCSPCNNRKGDKLPGWEERQRQKDRAQSIAYREQHGQRSRKEVAA
jgi:5-methylcytosine-specific restriction enzyme A